MNNLFARVIAKRAIAFLLVVVLITASIPTAANAAPFTHKTYSIYFKNVFSDEEKEILKNNLYLYWVEENKTIRLTDDNLLVYDGRNYTGCYYIRVSDIPIAHTIQVKNSHDMVVAEYSGENSAQIFYPLLTFHLSVDGRIIDTVYGYGVSVTAPYDGTEAILQKEGLVFSGWYNISGTKIAAARYGILGNTPDNVVTYYAGWDNHIHKWTNVWSTNTYYHWHECIGEGVCNALISEKSGFGLHNYSGTTEVITPPDCTNTGINKVYCSQDGCNHEEAPF